MLLFRAANFDDEQESELEQLPDKVKHQVRLRELYISQETQVFPVTCVRGRCSVSLLSEVETLISYLEKEDAFYYQYVYDQKSLKNANSGDMRVGGRYQAEVPSKPLDKPEEEDGRNMTELESLLYTPENRLTEDEIEEFITLAKSVGTYARALDCSSSVKLPNLHMGAASASRDITAQKAMDLLHEADYDFAKAVRALVPGKCPVLCRDQLDEWTAAEASLFEEGFEKIEKDFRSIQEDYVSILRHRFANFRITHALNYVTASLENDDQHC